MRGIVVLIFPLDFCSEFVCFVCDFGEEKKGKRDGREGDTGERVRWRGRD